MKKEEKVGDGNFFLFVYKKSKINGFMFFWRKKRCVEVFLVGVYGEKWKKEG